MIPDRKELDNSGSESPTSREFIIDNDAQKPKGYEQQLPIFQSLDPLQRQFLLSHADDVASSSALRESIDHNLRSRPFFSMLFSWYSLMAHTALAAVSDPLAPVTNPINYFYATSCYILIYAALFIFQSLLVIIDLLGLSKAIDSISDKYADGYGMTCWTDPRMFEKQQDTIQAARPVLSGALGGAPHASSGIPELEFSLDVAKSILLMASILYERDQKAVQRAFDYPEDACINLLQSEEKILRVGKEWNCQFTAIADFYNAEAPFAGAFYDLKARPNPFMVIVFKGTSPQAMSEWITDSTLNLEACSDRLGAGFAHRGFYSCLFPSSLAREQPSPYVRIIQTITKVARHVYEETGTSMNLFVGGHSLGAAMASLFYARLLESPEDLGPHTILRDAYCFGTPRSCTSTLASRFEYNLAKPLNHFRTLWRISNRSSSKTVGDIVTHVPPGLADRREARSAIKEPSLFSYAAIGIPIDILPRGKPPFYKFTLIPSGHKLKLVEFSKSFGPFIPTRKKTTSSQNSFDINLNSILSFNPLVWFNFLLKVFVPSLHDHFPGSYLHSLNKISLKDDTVRATKSTWVI